MENLLHWINRVLAPPLYKVTQHRWIASILGGFQKNMTIILVGAIMSIVVKIATVITKDPNNVWTAITNLTFGVLSIFIAFGIAATLARYHQVNEITTGVVAVSAFLILNRPTFTPEGLFQIQAMRLGAIGLFLAIIAGLLAGEIMGQFLKRNWSFRTDNLPDFAKEWFTPIIPAAIVILVCWVVAYILKVDLFEAIALIIRPLMTTSDTFVGFFMICFVLTALFAIGINGAVTFGVLIPLWMAAVGENAALVQQGLEPVHINTMQTLIGWVILGGTGATLTLNFLMLRSRSNAWRALGKAALLPSLMNINEPLIFGLPIAFNPILAIPFILNGGIINPILTYLAMSTGMLAKPSIPLMLPWVPVGLSGFLFNHDWRGLVLLALELVINYFVWFPFFKAAEHLMTKNEELAGSQLPESVEAGIGQPVPTQP